MANWSIKSYKTNQWQQHILAEVASLHPILPLRKKKKSPTSNQNQPMWNLKPLKFLANQIFSAAQTNRKRNSINLEIGLNPQSNWDNLPKRIHFLVVTNGIKPSFFLRSLLSYYNCTTNQSQCRFTRQFEKKNSQQNYNSNYVTSIALILQQIRSMQNDWARNSRSKFQKNNKKTKKCLRNSNYSDQEARDRRTRKSSQRRTEGESI